MFKVSLIIFGVIIIVSMLSEVKRVLEHGILLLQNTSVEATDVKTTKVVFKIVVEAL